MTRDNFDGYRIVGRPWTEEETARLRQGVEAKESHDHIAQVLKRTVNAVKSKVRDMDSAAERNERRRQKRAGLRYSSRIDHGDRAPSVPDTVMQDLISRLTAPRSLTAVLMGDPPFPAIPSDPRVLA